MDAHVKVPERAFLKVALDDISANPMQPRREFGYDALISLSKSISEHGLLSPLLIRKIGIGKYELIAGERRYRALKLLGITHADCVLIPAFDLSSAVMALIENMQRENLHFLDEAEACRMILVNHHITQEELARQLGKSAPALANRLRLIRLPANVKDIIVKSGLTERHARALLMIDDAAKQTELANEAAEKGYTVRQLEQKIAKLEKTMPRQGIKRICRDERLYVNAVMDAVRRISDIGANATASVKEIPGGTEITVTIKAVQAI